MTLVRLSRAPRFRPAALFRPDTVAVLGAEGRQGGHVLRNLAAGGARERVVVAALGPDGTIAYRDRSATPPDMAVLCEGGGAPEAVLPALAASGVFACVVMAPAEPWGMLRRLAEQTGVRSLGAGSFGVAVPAIGLDATLGHLPATVGRVALVSQSAGLCRTVLDWAAATGVGFSHVVGVGTNDDLGYGLVLDWLSRDPGTGAILLDIRRLKDARRFLSAARAAARLRPVVAIRAGGLAADATGLMDATLAAALHRVGVLCVDRLEDFLGAAETLARVKPVRGERLAIVSNAVGPARLAGDAAARDGVATLPAVQVERSGLAEAARAAGAGAEAGGVLVLHAPEGEGDEAIVAALAGAASAQSVPWLVCALGEATGAASRRALGTAGVAAFATPDAAVRAFAHLVQDRRGRAAARELPPADMLEVRPDRARVRAALAGADLPGLLAEYGIVPVAVQPGRFCLATAVDPVFGPCLTLGPPPSDHADGTVVDLPPLNLRLARAMVQRSRPAGRVPAATREALAALLVRVSALLVDEPGLGVMRFDPAIPATGEVAWAPPGAPRPRLALPPYPSSLVGWFEADGERLLVRPIRPEDADAHAAFFRRLPPEDIRRRFFATLRELSAEQIVRMTEIDYEREMAFVAVRGAGTDRPATVGVARLARETLSNEGEFAVVVQPDVKGHGLARHLVGRLLDWGRSQGLDAVVGEILLENQPMRHFIERMGFVVRHVPDDPEVLEARFDLRPSGA